MEFFCTGLCLLCMELAITGYPPGNIELTVAYDNLTTTLYSQEDKHKTIEILLCRDFLTIWNLPQYPLNIGR